MVVKIVIIQFVVAQIPAKISNCISTIKFVRVSNLKFLATVSLIAQVDFKFLAFQITSRKNHKLWSNLKPYQRWYLLYPSMWRRFYWRYDGMSVSGKLSGRMSMPKLYLWKWWPFYSNGGSFDLSKTIWESAISSQSYQCSFVASNWNQFYMAKEYQFILGMYCQHQWRTPYLWRLSWCCSSKSGLSGLDSPVVFVRDWKYELRNSWWEIVVWKRNLMCHLMLHWWHAILTNTKIKKWSFFVLVPVRPKLLPVTRKSHTESYQWQAVTHRVIRLKTVWL